MKKLFWVLCVVLAFFTCASLACFGAEYDAQRVEVRQIGWSNKTDSPNKGDDYAVTTLEIRLTDCYSFNDNIIVPLDCEWKLTLKERGTNDEIVLKGKPAQRGSGYYSFELCFMEGGEDFIPMMGVYYEMKVEIYREGELRYFSANSTLVDCDIAPALPADHKGVDPNFVYICPLIPDHEKFPSPFSKNNVEKQIECSFEVFDAWGRPMEDLNTVDEFQLAFSAVENPNETYIIECSDFVEQEGNRYTVRVSNTKNEFVPQMNMEYTAIFQAYSADGEIIYYSHPTSEFYCRIDPTFSYLPEITDLQVDALYWENHLTSINDMSTQLYIDIKDYKGQPYTNKNMWTVSVIKLKNISSVVTVNLYPTSVENGRYCFELPLEDEKGICLTYGEYYIISVTCRDNRFKNLFVGYSLPFTTDRAENSHLSQNQFSTIGVNSDERTFPQWFFLVIIFGLGAILVSLIVTLKSVFKQPNNTAYVDNLKGK